MNVAFVPVHSVLHDETAVTSIISRYGGLLKGVGDHRFERRDAGTLAPDDEAVFFVVTGGTERLILDAVEGRPGPVTLLAHPGQNSLPASLEVLARLQQSGRLGKVVYLDAEAPPARVAEGLTELREALLLAATHRRLHTARVGLVGRPSDWLVASSPGPGAAGEVWGPEVVPVEMDEVLRALDEVRARPNEAAALKDAFLKGAEAVREPDDGDLTKAAQVYVALRLLVDRERLDALTVRCFDLVLRAGTTGCLALSMLTDEGVIAGCEGDLPATLTMLLLHHLSGETPFMANPARVDPAAGSLWLAHCTVGRRLLTAYTIRSHFESGLGVGIQGKLRPGPVTVARIGGEGLNRLYVAEGTLTANGVAEDLCRTQVQVKLDGGVDYFLRRPLGNHHVLVYGHWGEILRAYAGLIGVETV